MFSLDILSHRMSAIAMFSTAANGYMAYTSKAHLRLPARSVEYNPAARAWTAGRKVDWRRSAMRIAHRSAMASLFMFCSLQFVLRAARKARYCADG